MMAVGNTARTGVCVCVCVWARVCVSESLTSFSLRFFFRLPWWLPSPSHPPTCPTVPVEIFWVLDMMAVGNIARTGGCLCVYEAGSLTTDRTIARADYHVPFVPSVHSGGLSCWVPWISWMNLTPHKTPAISPDNPQRS